MLDDQNESDSIWRVCMCILYYVWVAVLRLPIILVFLKGGFQV